MQKEKMLVPKLRFPEFEGSWHKSSLGNVIEYTKGYAFKSNTYQDKGIRIVRVSDLGADSIKKGNEKLYISKQNSKGLDKYLLKKNDIIITTVGSHPKLIESAVGRGVFVNSEDEGFLNQNLLKIEQSLLIDSKFLFSHLNSSRYRYYIKGIKRGNANQANITVKELLEYRISLTSLPEQQKIANFLTTIDTQIQTLSTKKSLLEQYKKGVMQKIFKQEIRFKNEDGNDFAEWEFKNGNLLFKSISDKNHNSDLPILAVTQDQGAIPRHLIDYNIGVTAKSVSSYKVVQVGDFIISLRSFQGGIEYSNYKGICSPAYIILRSQQEMCKDFYKYYLKTPSYIQELTRKLEGIRDGKMISYKYFSEIKLPYPSLKEQIKIASFLSAIDKEIVLVATKIEHTKTYKKGLLQQMFV